MRRLRRRIGDERGSVLALTAILMTAILGIAAFGIDLASYYQVKQQAQSAADAAALAAVQDLPANAATARTDATTYGGTNIKGSTVTPTTPYPTAADTGEIKVTVTKTVPSIIGSIIGTKSATVTGTAVAKKTSSGGASSVFAMDSSCGHQAITINGNNNTLNGVHSNGSFFNNGNNGSFGTTTYGGPSSCSDTENGNGNTYTGGAPVLDKTLYPWPSDFSGANKPACTYSGSSFTWNSNNATIPAGVYCATGQISINGNGLSGNVTFIADSFNLNGNNESFTPFSSGLLIYQTGSNSLVINGNNYVNLGTVFAPTANVVLNGNNGTVNGFIEGLDVTITANNITFAGTGPPLGGAGGAALIQ